MTSGFLGLYREIARRGETVTPEAYLMDHAAPIPLPCRICGERLADWSQWPSGGWKGTGKARAWEDDGRGAWHCLRTCGVCQARAEEMEASGRGEVVRRKAEETQRARQLAAGVPEIALVKPRALALELQRLGAGEGKMRAAILIGEEAGSVALQVLRHYLDLRWRAKLRPTVEIAGRAAEEVRSWGALDLVVMSGAGGSLAGWDKEALREGLEGRLDRGEPWVAAAREGGRLREFLGDVLWFRVKREGTIRAEGGGGGA